MSVFAPNSGPTHMSLANGATLSTIPEGDNRMAKIPTIVFCASMFGKRALCLPTDTTLRCQPPLETGGLHSRLLGVPSPKRYTNCEYFYCPHEFSSG